MGIMSKRTALLSVTIITLGISASLYLGLTMRNSLNDFHHTWDVLIFTQTWPNTLCYIRKSRNPNNTCNFPSQKNLWTIRGIWPSKLRTTGPNFCNKSLVFNPVSIDNIKDKLNKYWTDVELPFNYTSEGNSSNTKLSTSYIKESIWFQEWEKHGTCAVSLPSLNSEFKYFYQGIAWSEKYNMKDILEKGDIQVNSTLNINDYWNAVKTVLNTTVWIQCYFKYDTKEQMLAEIRICFDKTLKPINCNGIIKSRRGTEETQQLTNCHTNKPILYLESNFYHITEHNTSTVFNNSTNINSTQSTNVYLIK